MRLHFAAEIILELVYQHLRSVKKVGAHIAQDKARIDFEWGENISKMFPLIQEQARSIVEANQESLALSAMKTQRKDTGTSVGLRGFPAEELTEKNRRNWRDRVKAEEPGQR